MKNLNTYFILLSLLIVKNSYSQTIKIVTTSITFEEKLRPSLASSVDLSSKELEKTWTSYLKKKHSIKLKGSGIFSSNNFLKAEDVTDASITDKRFNLYSQISDMPNGSSINVFASFGYDIFMGTENYPLEFNRLQTILRKFLLETLNEFYAQKNEDLAKEINSLTKDKTKELKTIKNNKSKIFKLNKEIVTIKAVEEISEPKNISSIEKINKLTLKKTNLENENISSKINVEKYDTKLLELEKTLEEVVAKHNNLLN